MTRVVALPYEPDDDVAADRMINDALRTRDTSAWRALTQPKYVLQTERILFATLEDIERSIGQRKAEFDRIRDRRAEGVVSHEEWTQHKQAWQEWKGRTEHFQVLTRQYLRMVVDCARPVRGDGLRHELISAVRGLAEAVQRHRAATLLDGLEPSAADRALWARLSLVRVQVDEVSAPVTLDELARPEAPPSPLREPIADTTMLAARLVLELSEVSGTVPRVELSSEWARRADHLRSESGGIGQASTVLGKLLRRWERDGLTRRRAVDSTQLIDVVDRDGLRSLAHPD